MKRLALALVLCLLLPVTSFAATVKIGLMAPLTGDYASEGADMQKIVGLLSEEVNKKGGINGKSVEIVVQDDGSDARTAANAAQRLSRSGIVAVIGTYGSAVTEASQNIYNRNKLVQIATGSTSIRLTSKGLPNFFRTCPRDDEQGLVAVATLKNMGFKNVAIVHDNTAYAKGLADEVKSGIEKDGSIKIASFSSIQPKESDYNTALIRLKNTAPDAIMFTGYYPEAAMLLRQMKGMNWSVPMLGGDATNNTDLVKIGGTDAVAGFYFISPPMPGDLNSSAAKDFIKAYQARYNSMPSSIWSVAAGDAFNVLVEAIKNAGEKPEAISAYLHKNLKDFDGLTGKISFDTKGDRVGDLYRLYKVDASGAFILQ